MAASRVSLLVTTASCLLKDFMVIRCIYRRIDVFRYSGNFGAADHYSGDFIFAQNLEQRAGKKIGRAQAGDCDFRENATGYCCLGFVAGGDGNFYATLDKRFYPLSLSRRRPGGAYMGNLLGVNRIPEEMTGYWIPIAGHRMPDKSSLILKT